MAHFANRRRNNTEGRGRNTEEHGEEDGRERTDVEERTEEESRSNQNGMSHPNPKLTGMFSRMYRSTKVFTLAMNESGR